MNGLNFGKSLLKNFVYKLKQFTLSFFTSTHYFFFLFVCFLIFPLILPDISIPWQIPLLGIVIELILAIFVDRYYQNFRFKFFGKKSFSDTNPLLNSLSSFFVLPEFIIFEENSKDDPADFQAKDYEEFLIKNLFFSVDRFTTYNKVIKVPYHQVKLLLILSFLFVILLYNVFILTSVFFTQNSLSVFPSMFFVNVLFFHVLMSKRKYSRLQKAILLLNHFFKDLDLTFTRVDINSFYHADIIVLKSSRELLRDYSKKYAKSVRVLAQALLKLKLVNLCLSTLVIFIFIYSSITLLFGLEFNFLYQVFIVQKPITIPESLLLLSIFFLILFLYVLVDGWLIFGNNNKLFILDKKRDEVETALLKALEINSNLLNQASLADGQKEIFRENIANITSLINDIDLILNSQPGYYNYVGMVSKYLAYIAGIASWFLVVFNILSFYFS